MADSITKNIENINVESILNSGLSLQEYIITKNHQLPKDIEVAKKLAQQQEHKILSQLKEEKNIFTEIKKLNPELDLLNMSIEDLEKQKETMQKYYNTQSGIKMDMHSTHYQTHTQNPYNKTEAPSISQFDHTIKNQPAINSSSLFTEEFDKFDNFATLKRTPTSFGIEKKTNIDHSTVHNFLVNDEYLEATHFQNSKNTSEFNILSEIDNFNIINIHNNIY